MKEEFELIEENGVVIYDESDDYAPEDAEATQTEEGGSRMMTNEEIFTDEYMQEYARKMDNQIASEKRNQRLISIGVIATVILFIGIIVYITYSGAYPFSFRGGF